MVKEKKLVRKYKKKKNSFIYTILIIGEKLITFEEFLPIYAEFFKMPEKYFGTLEDFQEGLKLYDKESNGTMSLAELSQVLVSMGM